MSRTGALFVALILMLVLVVKVSAQSVAYDPASTAAALLRADIPPGDLYWYSPFEEVEPDGNGAMYEIRTNALFSLVTFEIYPDVATAADGFVELGVPFVLDRENLEVSNSSSTISDDLRRQEADALLGKEVWVYADGSGAGACGLILNVKVCGYSTYSSSNTPDGAAIYGVENGMALVSAVGISGTVTASTKETSPIGEAARPAPVGDSQTGSTSPASAQVSPPPADGTGPNVALPAPDPGAQAPVNLRPVAALPGGLTAADGRAFRVERDEAVSLDAANPGAPRAVAGYTASEVAWILDHPDFMGGGPHARVVAALQAGSTGFLAGYPDPAGIAARLDALGWAEGHRRVFALDGPPAGSAGYLDIAVARFASPAGAAEAVPFLAGELAAVGSMFPVGQAQIGDAAAAVEGAAVNGSQRTVFVAHGPYLIAVTGVASVGDPAASIDAVVGSIVRTLSS